MTIWKSRPTLKELNRITQNTIHHPLGIQFTDLGEDYLEASMPVDSRTHQPAGILHGGASVVLAESLGSVASLLAAGIENSLCVGLEVSASHLNAVRNGTVYGRATPIRIGKTIQVWEIRIRNGASLDSTPVCHSKLTVMVKTKKEIS
jgi:1,4-dihydroxy-2-naphthoyl-CoA hydrolase